MPELLQRDSRPPVCTATVAKGLVQRHRGGTTTVAQYFGQCQAVHLAHVTQTRGAPHTVISLYTFANRFGQNKARGRETDTQECYRTLKTKMIECVCVHVSVSRTDNRAQNKPSRTPKDLQKGKRKRRALALLRRFGETERPGPPGGQHEFQAVV